MLLKKDRVKFIYIIYEKGGHIYEKKFNNYERKVQPVIFTLLLF